MAKGNFEQTLKAELAKFKRNIKGAKDSVAKASIMALEHFGEHGNTTPLQMVYDCLREHGGNFCRPVAFLKWATAHAPVVVVNGKLLKDKSDDAVKYNLAGAKAKPFWDFAPNREQFIPYDAKNVVIGLHKYVRRMKNTRHKAENDEASETLLQVDRFCDTLAKQHNIDLSA